MVAIGLAPVLAGRGVRNEFLSIGFPGVAGSTIGNGRSI
jgi:hypothetical protein